MKDALQQSSDRRNQVDTSIHSYLVIRKRRWKNEQRREKNGERRRRKSKESKQKAERIKEKESFHWNKKEKTVEKHLVASTSSLLHRVWWSKLLRGVTTHNDSLIYFGLYRFIWIKAQIPKFSFRSNVWQPNVKKSDKIHFFKSLIYCLIFLLSHNMIFWLYAQRLRNLFSSKKHF